MVLYGNPSSSRYIYNKLWSDLKQEASIRDHARMNAISAQHAGTWLQALPNPNLGLGMPSREYIIAL